MGVSKDITGIRFGRLIAIEDRGDRGKKGQQIWTCRCDCGNETKVFKQNLIKGQTQSCGCLHKETIKAKKAMNITGRRFGKLTAIRPTDERVRGDVMWECQCDCGGKKIAAVRLLNYGSVRSCGCLSHQRSKEEKE